MKSKFSRAEFDARIAERALRDQVFKAKLLADPTRVYEEELRHVIPEGVTIRVVEEEPDVFYVVIPFLSEEKKADAVIVEKVARRELTLRSPCWGLGDGPE